jgi:hypothetical protein
VNNLIGESLFLRKLVLGIPAPASGKNVTRPLNASGAPAVLLHLFDTRQGVSNNIIAMTRRDFGMLCIFTPQKALRENAQPYRFWGLLGVPARSDRNKINDRVYPS